MDAVAEAYVRLVLAVGGHDPDYVDAYYGPPEWRTEIAANPPSLAEIRARASDALAACTQDDARGRSLATQLKALVARVDLLRGVRMGFDEESAALYDGVDPGHSDAYYAGAVAALDPLIPGSGPLAERVEAYRERFLIPPDRLAAVFDAAMAAARERTKLYLDLPEGEEFRTEYVKGQVWGAYNWYEGDARSLIQVNTDLPQSIESALSLACHEGYPGHHAYNALLEKGLAREKGWIEFTVYPLYSPQSLIAEGTAEYGVGLCFPPEARLAFERETLYPLAGLDPGEAEAYNHVLVHADRLRYASNDAARRYLDGETTRQETLDWLVTHTVLSPERAERRLRFIEQNRSYVITYNVGRDLVQRHVESRANTEAKRWAVFANLLSTPQVPSAL